MRTRAGFFMPEVFNKPPLTVDQQITLLESRKLIFLDKSLARHYLQFISYYRLSGYAFNFERKNDNGKRNHQFSNGTTFEDILNLYNFDRHLRLLVMDAIEKIEVAVRTQICLSLSLTHNDSHWYIRRELFSSTFNYNKFIETCKHEFACSKEIFIQHYRATYHTPELPPAWMMIELLTLGSWSILYENLINRHDKKQISDAFHLSPVEMRSWLHCLTYIRNLCAHHARLWNRHFTIRPAIKPEYKKFLSPNHTFSAQAAMINIFLKQITLSNTWAVKLSQLMTNNPFLKPERMGFYPDWDQEDFWM